MVHILVGLHVHDNGFQQVFGILGLLIDLPLSKTPDVVAQEIQIRRARMLHIGWGDVIMKILSEPLMGHVRRS